MTPWLLAATLFAASSDGWGNLKHITRNRPYAVVLRDGQCQYGALSSVGDQAIVLAAYSGLGVLIKRSEITRVTDDPVAPARGAVFSARSSWLDVKTAAPKRDEYFRIVTKGREEWKWKQPEVSDDSIVFERNTIKKADVHSIFYVRAKPLTNDEEYLNERDFKWLASIPWLDNLAPGKISILLYSADLPEDNSSITCR